MWNAFHIPITPGSFHSRVEEKGEMEREENKREKGERREWNLFKELQPREVECERISLER